MQGSRTVVTTGSRPAPSEAVREAVNDGACTWGVILAAEFVAAEEHAVDEPSMVAVMGTASGVGLAHVLAFNLAARRRLGFARGGGAYVRSVPGRRSVETVDRIGRLSHDDARD